MKSQGVLSGLIVLSVLLALMVGCAKKEETAPPASIQAIQQEVSKVVPSPTMEHFLKNAVRGRKATADQGIRDFFDRWQQTLHKRSIPTEIRFQAKLEDTFQTDRTWTNTTNGKILDSLCQENNLVWTITKPNTIRITKKLQ